MGGGLVRRMVAAWRRAGRRARGVVALVVSVSLAGSATAAVVFAGPGGGVPVPGQPVWGGAAGRAHRVPASATIQTLAGGRLVPAAVGGGRVASGGALAVRAATLPAGRRPRLAVPAAAPPPRVRVRVSGPAASVRALGPARARPVAGFSPATSRQVPALASADKVVYANADGTRTAFVFQSPVNYRTAGGSWAAISTTLVPAGGPGPAASASAPSPSLASPQPGSPSPLASSAVPSPSGSAALPGPPQRGWRLASAADQESFAAYADAAPLVSLSLGGSRGVGLGGGGAAHAGGVARGDAVTYPGVGPHSDLRFVAGAGLVQEQLILASAAAPAVWVYPLRLAGLVARTGPGGVIEFADAAGRVVAYVPHGLMTDSDIDPRSGDGAVSAGVQMSLTRFAGGPAIRMTLDKRWLDAPGRVFPVTVDPSVSALNSTGTTYVMNTSSSDFSGDTEIKVGTYDGGTDIAKSFMKFDVSSLANDTVLGARLGLFNSWSFSCHPRTVYVYPVTASWSVTGSKSWPGPSTGAAIGRRSFATGWVPLGSTVSPCPAKWEPFNLDQAGTNLINGWTHGTTANDGLALGASPTDSYGWKKFTSINNPTGDPFLSVTYTIYGADYKLPPKPLVTPVTPTQNGKIKITVTNEGSATWTSSNGYELGYRVYDAKGKQVTVSPPIFTPMPSGTSVAPGGHVTLDAVVGKLPAGAYKIVFDMYANATSSSPVSFSSEGIAPFGVGLFVAPPPPVVVTGVYPPAGFLSPTNTPQLSTTITGTGTGTTSYQFALTCHPLPGTTCPGNVIGSGSISKPYWTPPPLIWNEPYTWTVTVTNGSTVQTAGPVAITPQVPQPLLTSRLGGGSGQAFDPESGDYTTSATEAAVAVAGPPLQIVRDYNSLDPRESGAFGAGWSSVLDVSIAADDSGDPASGRVVTMPDGRQARFGYNGTSSDGSATYIPPAGSRDVLVHNASGTWSLMVPGGVVYGFTAAGALSKITDPGGLSQSFTYSGGLVSTITDTASGRALHLTWASAAMFGAFEHVTSVATDPPAAGAQPLTWSYTYSGNGNELTQVCSPSGSCTGYSYGTWVSHFAASVLDSGPRVFYRLGDAAGSGTAEDAVDVNLGTTDGKYSGGVTLGGGGPLGGGATSASFNGTSGYATLAPHLIADSTHLSVGLWFKAAAGKYGSLLANQAGAVGTTGNHTPVLYVGTDGKLRGEFWNGKDDPITTSGTVTDGNWHYAVLTGSGSSQALYLDGTRAGTLSGTIDQLGLPVDLVGAGDESGNWPAHCTCDNAGYFTGSIAEVAIYQRPLSGTVIAQQYALAATSPELTKITLPSGRVFERAAYDTASDRVSSYTDPNGGIWAIHLPLTTGFMQNSETLGQADRSVTVADPAGRDEVYTYDAINGGRLIAYNRGAGAGPRTYGYDAAGFLDAVTDEDTNAVTFTNDAQGNVLSRTWADVTGCPPTGQCTTYYSYYGNPASAVDPRNNQLTAIRDARSSGPADNTYLTSYAYNPAGQVTSSTTPATADFPSGRTTSYAYSTTSTAAYGGGTTPAGLLVSQTTPGGAVTSYSYYPDGDLAQVTTPSGQRTVYTYDALGRPQTATTYSDSFPGGLATSWTYNPAGQPLTVTHPGVSDLVTGAVHTLEDSATYDSNGDLTHLTESDTTGGDPSRNTIYTYDDHGNLATVTDPAGATTAYDYDPSGNVVTVTDADGNERDYTYNEYGKVTQVTLHASSTSQASPGATSDLVTESLAYDPAGLLASVTDAMGRTTSYAYDPGQELIAATQTDPSTSPAIGRQTAYGYDNAGNLASQAQNSLSGGKIIASTVTDDSVDAAGRLTSQAVDPAGLDRVTSYGYDADNHTTSVTVTGGGGTSETSYAYDTAGGRVSQDVHDGSASLVTTWTYDQRGLPLTMTTPLGNASGGTPANYTTSYSYDENGQLSSVTAPPVPVQSYTAQTPATTRPVTTFGYDTYGDQAQAQDASGNLTSSGYDGDGRLTSVTQPPYTPPGATAPVTATASLAYDGLGQLTAATDPAGNTTSYAYDALGDLTSQTDPQLTGQSAPGVWAWTYDNAGEQLTATTPAGAQTQSTWDYFGDQATATQLVRGTSQPEGTTSYGYDYRGDLVQATSPDGVVTTAGYDPAGELTSATDAAGNTAGFTYNQLGQVTSITLPDQTSQALTYDPAGNLTAVTDYSAPPSPAVLDSATFGYDANGDRTSATDGRGNTTSYAYDAAGELTSTTQPVTATTSDTTSYGYDAAWNQTSVTSGNGNTTWTTYNPWNLPESVIEPATPAASAAAQRTWTTSYDADGRPVSVTQPGGITMAYGYDQAGDLTSQTGSGAAAATPAQSFGYDTSGQLTSATAPGGTDTFSYNDAGNLTATAGPSGTAAFTYNGDGQMASRADAAGTTTYTYDQAGRLATTADPLTGGTMTYGYNPDSLPATISYATSGTPGPQRSYTYNGLHQLTGDTLTAPGGATIASASYGYDANGNLTTQATTGYAGAGTTTYGYDKANQLTSATTGGTTTSYAYDADGNLTQAGPTTSTYNAQDQLTTSTTPAGTTSYGYTLSGALASVTPSSGAAQNYTANAYGQTITAPGGITYAYDALGRLATRTTTSATTTFAYSGTSPTLASDGTTTYSNDPAGNPIAARTGTNPAQALLANAHGDITGAFTPTAAATTLTASAAYSPYGTTTATNGTMPSLGYQGQYTDPATGNTLMGARWYSPATGTFTTNDTLAGSPIPATINPTPYAYASGNPLTNTDPTGHLVPTPTLVELETGTEIGLMDVASLGLLTLPFLLSGDSAQPSSPPAAPYQYGYWDPFSQYNSFVPGISSADPFAQWNSGWGPYNSPGGGSSGSGGGCCYVPYYPYVSYYPPPPPPPPQDLYAGPNPLGAPPPPTWMRTAPYTTGTGRTQRHLPRITEHTPRIPHINNPVTPDTPTITVSTNTTDTTLTQKPLFHLSQPTASAPTPPGSNPTPTDWDWRQAKLINKGFDEAVRQGARLAAAGAGRGNGGGSKIPKSNEFLNPRQPEWWRAIVAKSLIVAGIGTVAQAGTFVCQAVTTNINIQGQCVGAVRAGTSFAAVAAALAPGLSGRSSAAVNGLAGYISGNVAVRITGPLSRWVKEALRWLTHPPATGRCGVQIVPPLGGPCAARHGQ